LSLNKRTNDFECLPITGSEDLFFMGTHASRDISTLEQSTSQQYSRISAANSLLPDSAPSPQKELSADILPMRPFAGVWSVLIPNCLCPPTRAGHFTVVDTSSEIAYIGYGTSKTGAALTDLWALDLRIFEWRQIPLDGTLMPPRNGARAVLLNGKLFVFGGFYEKAYFSDPYIIDPSNGKIAPVQTTGDSPSARSTPIMEVADDGRVFLWGGYNGEWPSAIHILDTSTYHWTSIASPEKGRTSVPSVKYGNKIVSYGGSNRPGLCVLDMTTSSISIMNASGVGPPPDSMKAGMVRVGRHLFFVGGRVKGEPDWTLLYVLDADRMWWFVFFVIPDGDSVTARDGLVQSGCFLLPRIHAFGMAYAASKRAIVAFLGCPFTDPPRLFVVNIAEGLAVINLRDDMRNMLMF
jgi:hypothetical protein